MPKNNFFTNLDLQKNSFGFLRFFLAVAVLYHHSFILGGFGEEPFAEFIGQQENVGSLAVLGFFIISGFLVTNSLFHSKTFFSYGLKRFLRIMPAFWTCLIITAFIFAPLIYWSEKQTLQGFFSLQKGPFEYIKNNFFLFMHQYEVNNLLNKNPFPLVFDGSLWTLILEAKAYILFGILGYFQQIKNRRAIFLIFFIILSVIFLFNINIPKPENPFLHFFLDPSVAIYSTYFFAGVVFYFYRKEIPFNTKLFTLSIFVTIIALFFNMLHQTLLFTAPYIIFWLAAWLPFRRFARFGDFSYGIYIYAFPVQQLLTYFKYNENYLAYVFYSFVITVVLAGLSWHIVEKPALQLKKKLKETSYRAG